MKKKNLFVRCAKGSGGIKALANASFKNAIFSCAPINQNLFSFFVFFVLIITMSKTESKPRSSKPKTPLCIHRLYPSSILYYIKGRIKKFLFTKNHKLFSEEYSYLNIFLPEINPDREMFVNKNFFCQTTSSLSLLSINHSIFFPRKPFSCCMLYTNCNLFRLSKKNMK